MGPFIPSSHPLIQNGKLDELDPEELFGECLGRPLSMFADTTPTTVILMPSVKCMVSGHAAFPQSPIDRKDPRLKLSKVSDDLCSSFGSEPYLKCHRK